MLELTRMLRSRAFWLGVQQGLAAPIGIIVYGWSGYWRRCDEQLVNLIGRPRHER